MNPGGDFGKKELSPALRDRFTEVRIGSVGKASEMENIAAKRMSESNLAVFAKHLAEFWQFYHENAGSSTARAALAVRDLIGWANFMRENGGLVPSRVPPLLLRGVRAWRPFDALGLIRFRFPACRRKWRDRSH